jgi:peptidoglycan hydrolase-like protein with peptidoglycan-binding domain
MPTSLRAVALIGLGLAAAAAAIVVAVRPHGGSAAEEQITVRTVEITRTDLSSAHTLRGTLGFGTAQPLKGMREGVVTWLPAPGTTIVRGQPVYRVNDEPAPLFYGSVPLYRPLAERNTVGRDVAVVVANLQALGYAVGAQPKAGQVVTLPSAGPSASAAPVRFTVRAGDGVLTTALIAAIKSFQRDHDLPPDGRIDVGDVAVLPGAVRVDAVTAQPGDSATGPLLTVTPTVKVVTVQTDTDTIRQGDATTVRLPGGKEAPGTVTAVGVAAAAGPGAGQPRPTITIVLDDPAVVDRLDAAEVQVDVAGETHRGVLAVPVGALLALSEGGYAVQLADGGLIPVQTGLFAKGMVEISGAGLGEGLRVVTTS